MRISLVRLAVAVALTCLPSHAFCCATERSRCAPQTRLVQPVDAPVSRGFGMYFEPLVRRFLLHAGIDFEAEVGCPVRAVQAGRVALKKASARATEVRILHARGISTLYRHLGRIDVQDGECVEQAQVIGTVGSTGKPSGHLRGLHFEVRSNAVNPMRYLPPEPMPSRRL